ncbi:hypothetical protein CPB85DRAFT_1309351 [Mucidula mucida]|nr:hypothetical protein CPB85DRAFT_1309351 [Mucidula mucida]
MRYLSLLTFFALGYLESPICEGQTTLEEFYIGAEKNVKVEKISCATPLVQGSVLEARQTNGTNVCGATCNTNCFQPSGGGPDPNDCHVIADALRYESQNTGALFQVPNGTNNTILMTYSSCKSFFVNQDLSPVIYCRTDWAGVLDWVAPNCQSTQNAHGGNCVAADQRWFVQVEHS